MAEIRFSVRTVGFALAAALAICPGGSAAAEFKPEAVALPFPPDARELEFVGWTGGISYKSHSPLKSLGAFYLKEMVARGWEHDEAAAEINNLGIFAGKLRDLIVRTYLRNFILKDRNCFRIRQLGISSPDFSVK